MSTGIHESSPSDSPHFFRTVSLINLSDIRTSLVLFHARSFTLPFSLSLSLFLRTYYHFTVSSSSENRTTNYLRIHSFATSRPSTAPSLFPPSPSPIFPLFPCFSLCSSTPTVFPSAQERGLASGHRKIEHGACPARGKREFHLGLFAR